MFKQFKDLGAEKVVPDNTDILAIQQADGATRPISRENFLTGIGSSSSNSEYPNSFSHWHDESTVLSGSPLAVDNSSIYRYSSIAYQPNAAMGDLCSFNVFVDAGDYAVNFLVHAFSNRGIFSVYVDNLLISDLDSYGNGMTTIVRNISIATPGIHTFKILTSGKNVSSSGYFLLLTKIWGTKL